MYMYVIFGHCNLFEEWKETLGFHSQKVHVRCMWFLAIDIYWRNGKKRELSTSRMYMYVILGIVINILEEWKEMLAFYSQEVYVCAFGAL